MGGVIGLGNDAVHMCTHWASRPPPSEPTQSHARAYTTKQKAFILPSSTRIRPPTASPTPLLLSPSPAARRAAAGPVAAAGGGGEAVSTEFERKKEALKVFLCDCVLCDLWGFVMWFIGGGGGYGIG